MTLYTAALEDATGKSLDPDNCRMMLPYQSWLDGRRTDRGDDEPDGENPL